MKNLKKSILVLIISLSAAAGLFAANAEKSFLPNEENVKFLGRSYYDKDVLWMCFSSTGAAFNVDAKRLDVQIAGDSAANFRKDNGSAARIVVFVNGERKVDEMILKQDQTFTVFDENKNVKGEVLVLKVSESANSIAGIKAIITDKKGSLSPAAKKDLKIEFIGDSITCGYGVDDLVASHHFATSTEDNTKSYAYKTAQALNADYSMVSVSGWGVVSGYTNGPKNSDSVLPKIYDKIGFTWGNSFNGKQPKTINWDFSRFLPDFVVVNLGTNDNSYTKKDAKKISEFVEAYVDFLKVIREKNPQAKIVCTLGLMGNDLFPAIQEAVEEYQKITDDSQVYAIELPAQRAAVDGIAADWHPSEKAHQRAADLLQEKLLLLK